jgi:hypothetical protein
MSVKVQLPPGCGGVTVDDGTRYNASKSGGVVEVSDKHGREISRNNQYNGNIAGILNPNPGLVVGTKRGQRCVNCRRVWQAWSVTCPRCGLETVSD